MKRVRLVASLCALAALGTLTSPAQADEGEGGKGEGGQFDIGCLYSHSLPDDPIVFPGVPGASHLHDFFGFKQIDAFSTAEEMLESLRADPHLTTCTERNDPETDPAPNASGYWAPAVYFNGIKVDPDHLHIYYRNFRGDSEPFPTGFKVIVGDPMAPPEEQRGKVKWFCAGPGNKGIDKIPEACDGQKGIKAEAKTPTCWDGRLDSEDHRSHVVYAEDYFDHCPASHPRRLPRLTIHFTYDVLKALGRRIRAKTDVVTLGGPGYDMPMHTFHADYLSAWEPDRLAFLVEFCLNQRRDCKRDPPDGQRATNLLERRSGR